MPFNSDTHAPPSKTLPELKWLLSERAALVGQRNRSAERATQVEAEVVELEAQLVAVRRKLGVAIATRAKFDRRIEAFDTALALVDARVRPEAAGCVRPWAGRYGERGALIDFLRGALRNAAPEPLSGTQLRLMVLVAFRLDIQTSSELCALKDSINSALRQLRSRHGVVVSESRTGQPTLWRWKARQTLDDLRALAQAASSVAGPPHDPPHPHPL